MTAVVSGLFLALVEAYQAPAAEFLSRNFQKLAKQTLEEEQQQPNKTTPKSNPKFNAFFLFDIPPVGRI